MRARKVTRLDTAVHIRDAAITLMRASGTMKTESDGQNYLTYDDPEYSMILRTPFQPKPPDEGEAVRIANVLGVRLPKPLGYGLDIWLRKVGKVLNIEWDHKGTAEIRGFRRGEWEAEVFRLASVSQGRAHADRA